MTKVTKITTQRVALDVLRHHKGATFFLLGTVFAVVLFSLLPPQILKFLIDDYLTRGQAEGLPMVAALYFGSFVLVGIFDFLKGLLLSVFGQRIVRAIRSAMARKLTRIKAAYFSANAGGTISAHFLNDVENINSLFSDGIISLVIDCFKIVGIVISIWLFSSQLGVFVLCLLPFLYALMTYFRKHMLLSQEANLRELGKVNNHLSETMKTILTIKSFHKERYMENRYGDYLQENYATKNRVNWYDSCYSPIIQMVTALSTAVVLLLASGGETVFGISIGMLAATISLLTNLFTPIDNLGAELQSIQRGISGIRSVDAFLAQDEDERQEIPVDLAALRRHGAAITFQDVSFAYEAGTAVLTQLDLHIAPRENVCFVGRTGVGKTTLFKLMTGLLCPTAGTITLGGVAVYAIPNSQKRQIFGYVTQQFSFVRGDISAQISLGDEQISQEQIERALIFTGLHDYVLTLDQGYQTEANDGSMFSHGQKQLLSIARAIVTDPPILLLDEVTANLDSVTEENVVAVLKKAGADKTILSITHRASSMLDSDRAVLLENGHIAAIGTPQEVMAQSTWLPKKAR